MAQYGKWNYKLTDDGYVKYRFTTAPGEEGMDTVDIPSCQVPEGAIVWDQRSFKSKLNPVKLKGHSSINILEEEKLPIYGNVKFDPVNYGVTAGAARTFDTGATRDTDNGKVDMEGFTHPIVMEQYAKYMNMHRFQSDGKLRASDNWQKGIPLEVYAKSLRRHHDAFWKEHRGFYTENGIIADLCGILFNTMGYLHEVLKERDWKMQDFDGDEPTPEMQERKDRVNNAEKNLCS